MSRISNLTKYPYDYNITEKDFVIGTNGDTNNKKTKNFPVVALAEYVRNFNNNLSYDRVISIGEITSDNNNIAINVNDLGNVVYINHTFYTKNTPDIFTFTPVTEGVKIILLYALPDEQIFYMLEGVQSIEAVEPTLPSGALFVQRIIVTVDGIEIIPSETLLLDSKIQVTETNSFANIGQSQKHFNKNVSDYKTASDLKNQEQDDRLTEIEGENAAQYDLINNLSSELESERTRNDIQDSLLENLEGIHYTWSPTNRTLTLFDRGGTQLSQVSLVSLDNEGTDIRYNASTLSLELYNADNELLDSIPVSSFIGSVGTQLQLNSNQLQLKDNQGNILSTVTFEISNISGLQTVLDGKLDKGTYTGNASDLKSLIDTKINGSGTDNYVSKFSASGTVANSQIFDDGTNVGIGKSTPSEKLDVNGYIKANGFKTPSGTANQSLTANGGTFDLNTKADLVGGKVPASQSRPSTIVMDNYTYVITFTDATGAIQTIDLPLESLFQDANYDETTKSLIVTLQDGTTRTIPLSDLVDLPEIVLATSNPAVTPTSGQKVYFNTSLGKVWFNVSGAWVFGGNLISDTEKTNLSTAYNHSQTIGNPHGTTKAQVGLGNVDNTSDLDKPISILTQLALDNKVNKNPEIVSSTKTKITYDSKGLVIDGDDATTIDINDSIDRRYVTDVQLNTIQNTSGINTGDETTLSIQTKRPLKTIKGESLEGVGNINLTKDDVGLSNVDNTSDANKPISTATQTALDLKVDKVAGKQLSTEDYTTNEKNKLAGIQSGAEVNVNADWNAITGDAQILNKPSTFTPSAHTHPISQVDNLQTTLDGKESTISAGTIGQYWRGDKTWQTLNKSAVGLSNVDNTSDANKPISNATQSALNAKADLVNGVIPSSQLPSYVDDVLEYANLASFPATGETGKIYVDTSNNKTYRWSGTVYVYITSGAVDSVNGYTGVINLTKSDIGLSNVDNTADATKNVLSATKWTTARTLTIGNTGKLVDGTGNVSWSLAEIGASPSSGSANYIQNQASSPQSANMWISGDMRSNSGIYFSPSNTDRALVRAEVGSGDFNIFQYDSGGAYLRNALSISNATGAATFASNITLNSGGYIYGDTTTPFLRLNQTNGTFLQYGNSGIWAAGSLTNIFSTINVTISTAGSERLRVDSNGNVGIGTTSPAAKLDMTDALRIQSSTFSAPSSGMGLELRNVAGFGSILSYDRTNDLYKPLIFDGSDITIKSNGNNRIYLNSSGNVGIGTTSPQWLLELYKDTSSGSFGQYPAISVNNPNASGYSAYYFFQGSTNKGGIEYNNSSNSFIFYGNNAERMRITSSGNVGIGTTSPSEKLDVNGYVKASGFKTPNGTPTQFLMADGSVNNTSYITKNSLNAVSTGWAIQNPTQESGIEFINDSYPALVWGASSAYMSDDGWLYLDIAGINQITDVPNYFSGDFYINNNLYVDRGITVKNPFNFLSDNIKTSAAIVGKFGTQTGGSNDFELIFNRSAAGTNAYYGIQSVEHGVGYRNIVLQKDGGNVGIGTTSPSYPLHIGTQISNISIYAAYDIVAFSDISVKTNIRPIDNVLERVNKSRGVLYDRVDSGEKNNIGFIAQELEEQFPELVVENLDGTKAVKYQNAVAILFEAIKEQQKQINELRNGITN